MTEVTAMAITKLDATAKGRCNWHLRAVQIHSKYNGLGGYQQSVFRKRICRLTIWRDRKINETRNTMGIITLGCSKNLGRLRRKTDRQLEANSFK